MARRIPNLKFLDGKSKKSSMVPSNDSGVSFPRQPRPQGTIFNAGYGLEEEASSEKLPSVPEASRVRNVVIFGDSGVGKSSLINMLAGEKTAATSDGVLGCTFQSRQYPITIRGEQINVWDTAGFEEGTRGRVSPEVAEKNLVQLLRDLRGANGIDLLVYCIRGPSLRKSLARNYLIFYSAICRKKVPIVAVVTGLENEPEPMDSWWTKGEKELAKYKMRFDAHACITTIDITSMNKAMGSVFEERSIRSQRAVRDLILEQCHRPAIRSPTDSNVFIKAAMHDFRSMVKAGWENMRPSASVTFYQSSDMPFIHTGVFGTGSLIRSQINGRSFVFHHANDLSGGLVHPKQSKSVTDLLIFSGWMNEYNVQKFREFYSAYSGEVCPLLVVTDERSVPTWTSYLIDCGISARVEPDSRDGRTSADLLPLIDELCLVRGSATRTNKEKILKLLRRGSKENSADA